MKTLIAIVLSCLLVSNVIAQTSNSLSTLNQLKNKQNRNILLKSFKQGPLSNRTTIFPKTNNTHHQKSFTTGKRQLDSVVYETLNKNNNLWVVDNKEEYYFNNMGLQVMFVFYDRDSLNNEWIGSFKEESEYDMDGNQTLLSFYEMDSLNENWIGFYKEVSEYDSEGKLSVFTFSFWDEFEEKWTNGRKTEYTYENGLMRLQRDFFWDGESDGWLSEGLWTFEYQDGLLMSQTLSEYFNQGEEPGDFYQIMISYFYDGQGNLIREETSENFEETIVWIPLSKTENTYKLVDKLESSVTHYFFEEWLPVYGEFYTYDDSGNMTSDRFSSWDFETEIWLDEEKQEYIFDQNGDLVSTIIYEWDDATGQLVGEFKNELTYDSSFSYEDLILPYDYPAEFFNHMITGFTQYEYVNDEWVLLDRGDFFYSNHSSSGVSDINISEIRVFPNPASGSVNFKGLLSQGLTSVEIFDFNGKRVKSEILPANGQLSLDYIKGGIYLYKLSSPGFTKTGKLIIN